MLSIIIQLRAMQLYTHHAHNLCAHTVFLQDHEFFGDVYSALEDEYDSVIERQIGLKGELGLELPLLLQKILGVLQNSPTVGVKENKVFYMKLLEMEVQLNNVIKQEISVGVSEGTRQMLGDICDRSEIRQYKIKQRIK